MQEINLYDDFDMEYTEDSLRPQRDKQVGGSHYQLNIEPIDYIVENYLGFMEGNVIKYVTRHARKNGADDIRKAIHYCELILEKTYGEEAV